MVVSWQLNVKIQTMHLRAGDAHCNILMHDFAIHHVQKGGGGALFRKLQQKYAVGNPGT